MLYSYFINKKSNRGENIVVDDVDEGNLIALGKDVFVGRNLSERVIIAGGKVIINSKAKEVYLVGKDIEINGEIEEDLTIAGEKVYINAPIGGDVKMVVKNAIVSKGIVIDGDIKIDGKLFISKGAVVKGDIYYEDKLPIVEGRVMGKLIKETNKSYFFDGHFSFLPFKLFSVFNLLILTYIIFRIKKELGRDRLDRYLNNETLILFTGFTTLVLIPIAILLLFITILGFPVGLLLILFYCILMFLAIPIANLIIATKYFDKINFFKLLLSSIIITLLINLPFVGWLIKLFLVILGLGSIIDSFKNKMRL